MYKNKWSLFVFVLLLLFSALFSISKLHFSEDISRILPHTKNTDKLKYVLKESTLMNKIIFDIHLENDSVNADLLLQYADEISDFLLSDSIKPYFRNLQLQIDDAQTSGVMDVVQSNLPLFLNDSDYRALDQKLDSISIRATVQAGYKSMLSPIGFMSSKYFLEDPFSISFGAIKKIKSFNLTDNIVLYRGRIVNKKKTDLFLFANLAKTNTTTENRSVLQKIDSFKKSFLHRSGPIVLLDVFGGPVVAEENAQQIKTDVAVTVSITLVLLISLLAYFFRKRRAIIVIFIPTLLGSLLALGVLSIFKTELSVISLAIGAVLLGMSIDFSLHVYSHYREHHSISKLFKHVSIPISLSALTTIVAFLSLKLVQSDVLSDLGLFASLSIFFSALFALTLLPLLIKSEKGKQMPNNTLLDKISAYEAHRNKYLMWLVFTITVLLYIFSEKVPFDSDMMHSNYMTKESARAEKRINRVLGRSNKDLYIITMASNPDAVLQQNHTLNKVLDSLQNEGLITKYSTVNKLIKSKVEQQLSIQRWEDFWSTRFQRVYGQLDFDARQIGFKKGAFRKFDTLVNKPYSYLNNDDQQLLSDVILNDFLIESDTLFASITVLKVGDAKKVKPLIDARINNPDVWAYNSQLFITSLIDRLNKNMSNLVSYSLFFVFIILLLYFGRIELTLITMIPIVFGYIWTTGIMSILGIQFNIFNVIILSFIFGLGIDYGIFITNGVLQKYTRSQDVIKEYKASILLSFLTTIIGIGALIFAQHPAMRSIAVMAIIGILSTLIITFTLQIYLLNLILYKNGVKRKVPITLLDFVLSVIPLIYFVSGAIFLTIISFIFRLIPFGTKYKKKLFHRVLQAFSWWMIYTSIFNKKLRINDVNEDFKKPAVIIANHQSHMDVMLALLQYPKILILTNDREWNNSLYGHVLHYADFLPITLPHEELIEQLKRKVELGYSIVIFPEGTRSADGVLKKFKRGAFFIARELNLEILPIIIHGTGALLSKKDFFLSRGQMTTKILPRIDLSQGEYGRTLKKQSQAIFELFAAEYEKLQRQVEKPIYYRGNLIWSYLYRSPIIEWYMRIKTRMENNYQYFDDLVPRNALISDLGCGYGFLIYTLAQTSKDRRFIGVDFDQDKIEIANNISLKEERIRFIHADLGSYDIENSDVILLTDVLHYMPMNKRHDILTKAFSKLNSGGVIIIRDGDREMKKKHKVTKLSEVLSTFIKFNKADYKDLDFLSRSELVDMANKLGGHLEIIDNTQYTSNIIYIIYKKDNK